MSEEVVKVGDFENLNAKCVRIVHISDTHMQHDTFQPLIPKGDILIHSGDFTSISFRRHFDKHDLDNSIAHIDSFFEKLPFKHKVFVAGNHEISFSVKHRDYIVNNLKHVTYLQDSGVLVEGINIYGSPWNPKRWYSHANGFAKKWGHFEQYWDAIPSDTDILVTHTPPSGIMDLATKKFKVLNLFSSDEGLCQVCTETHPRQEHWGCRRLRQTVFDRVKPFLHLFGHVHESNDIQTVNDVTFSNAAMKLIQRPHVFDFYVGPTNDID